jgi:signal transduction histidine kinase
MQPGFAAKFRGECEFQKKAESFEGGTNMNWGNTHVPSLPLWIYYSFRRDDEADLARERRVRLEEQFKERTRIAGELHDTLLQGLLSAAMQLHLASDGLPADSPTKPILNRAIDLIAKGIVQGRAALQGLRSYSHPETNLEKALADLREEFRADGGARLRIVVLGQPKELPPAVQEQVYLIAREALLNALRHSNAATVEAEIEYLPYKLRVVVRDNGSGIDPQLLRRRQDSHWGLLGMRERAGKVGGHLRLWSKPGYGTEVEISVRILPSRAVLR